MHLVLAALVDHVDLEVATIGVVLVAGEQDALCRGGRRARSSPCRCRSPSGSSSRSGPYRDRQRRGDDQTVLQEGEVLGLLLFGLGKRRPEDDLGPIAGVERPAVVSDAVGEPGHVAGAEKAIDTTTRSCVAGCYCRGIPLPSVAQSPHRTNLRLQGGPPRCRLLAARPAQLLLESLSQEDLE